MFDNNPIPITASHTSPQVDTNTNPDPYMIFHDGWYYCYTTGHHGVNVLRSQDIESFEHMGFALSVPGQISYWAPAVICYKGRFYMYYSSMLEGEDDAHLEFLKVAVADNPLGPFEYEKTLFNYFSIDADVIEKNGELHLFYAANDTSGDKIGTMVMIDKLVLQKRK